MGIDLPPRGPKNLGFPALQYWVHHLDSIASYIHQGKHFAEFHTASILPW
jgi:hypothetical protein